MLVIFKLQLKYKTKFLPAVEPDNAAIDVLQYSTTAALFLSAASLYTIGPGLLSFDLTIPDIFITKLFNLLTKSNVPFRDLSTTDSCQGQ